MKKFALLISLITIMGSAVGQQQYPIYTQYFFNPYLTNPSLVASTGRSEINVLYRQQWSGVKNAPQTIQADFQHPFSKKVALGVSIFNDQTVLLSNTSLMFTFGYKLHIAHNQSIGFGLSAGMNSNRVRVEQVPEVDMNDPGLLQATPNTLKFNGQFGINYLLGNFSIGAAFLRLINNENLSTEKIESHSFAGFENMAISASYNFRLTDEFSLQPNIGYRMTPNNFNYYETSALIFYKNILQVGGGYRDNFGPMIMARVRTGNLQFGYSFDFPSTYIQVSTGGTHEIQMKLTFGKDVDEDDTNLYKNYNIWWQKFNRLKKHRRKQYN